MALGLAIPEVRGIPASEGMNACRADYHLMSAQELWMVLEGMFLPGFYFTADLLQPQLSTAPPSPSAQPAI